MPADNDTWSPRSMRILMLVVAVIPAAIAFLLLSVFSWLWWLCVAVSVIALCAAITPPFRRPRG